jgi:hypothetical protein
MTNGPLTDAAYKALLAQERRLLITGPSPRGWHRLQQVLECPSKYAWGYLGKKEEVERPPLVKGSLIHLGLAHHYQQLKETQQGRDPQVFYGPMEAIRLYGRLAGGLSAQWAEMACGVLEAYLKEYRNETWEIVDAEVLADGQIGGFRFTGRFDLVYRDRQGRIWVVDHKTTTRFKSNQRRFYSISGQMLGYRLLAQQKYGKDFAGIRLNMIQHTGSIEFQRFSLTPAPNRLSQFPRTVAFAENLISKWTEHSKDPKDWPMVNSELVCFHRYGACDHLEKCTWGR